jgi:hypothetical protein
MTNREPYLSTGFKAAEIARISEPVGPEAAHVRGLRSALQRWQRLQQLLLKGHADYSHLMHNKHAMG